MKCCFSLHDGHLHDSKWQGNERTLGSEMTDSCLKGFSQIFAQTAMLYKLSIALPSSNLVLFFGQAGTHTGVSIDSLQWHWVALGGQNF